MTDNPMSDEYKKVQNKWFFALEPTYTMSRADIDELTDLLELLSKKYHFRWCQTFWKENMTKANP
jgi:hypothetical protein